MINVKVSDNAITAHVSKNNPTVNNSNIKVVKGDSGAVFTPHLDEDSNLSWTNNGNLPNPPTHCIRGEKGEKGEKGEVGTVTALTNEEIEAIMGGI